MIYFFADNHYGKDPGKHIFDSFPETLKQRITFTLDQWELLESGRWTQDCKLLILHLIGGTCNQPHPGTEAEKAVRRYCEKGGSILLLHGSSAAFWQWPWWREIVGLRWVRPNDPDNPVASTHPHGPCTVEVTKNRHPLVKKLRKITLPEDEIYTALEETAPVRVFMTSDVEGRTWAQCCETVSPWGGKIVSFIPGHLPVCTENPDLVADVEILIDYLLKGTVNE